VLITPKLGDAATRLLRKRGIDVRLGVTPESMTDESAKSAATGC
jgi:predicted Fe-Mo cluster-binding NifX family protein